MYNSMMSKFISGNWSGGLIKKVFKLLSLETYEFKTLVMKLSSSTCTSGLIPMRLYLLKHLVGDMKRYGDISFLDATFYEQFSHRIKRISRTVLDSSQSYARDRHIDKNATKKVS